MVLGFVGAAVRILDVHGTSRTRSNGESRVARDREWRGEERLSAGWTSAASANYDRIKIARLNPLVSARTRSRSSG